MADEIKIVGLSTPQTRSKTNWKMMGAIIGVVVLALGVLAGILLVRQQQDVREKAGEEDFCPLAEACPGPDGNLYNCHPPAGDGGPTVSICNAAGRVEFCGAREYCCDGSAWTTNMSACGSPTPSPTSSSTASPTATAVASATATGNATANPTSTPVRTPTTPATQAPTIAGQSVITPSPAPIPVTGSSWVTALGSGLGIIVIITSLALAL